MSKNVQPVAQTGGQFGDGFESENEDVLDSHDLQALYHVLEQEVLPAYYDNREQWIKMMQASINSTYQPFSARRMVEEYYEKAYTSSF